LNEIRADINSLDQDLRELLLKRIALSIEVAEQKKLMDNSVIYCPQREQEILSEITSGLSQDVSYKIESLYRSIIRQSREIQYAILLDTSSVYTPGFNAEDTSQLNIENPVICYQGLPGAYSHVASKKMYPLATYRNVRDFEDIFIEVSQRNASCGVVPLENSTAGMVSEVYDLLIKYHLFINRSFILPINHALLALPETQISDIKRLLSHPQALSQCREFIRRLGCDVEPVSNTAVAAKMVTEIGRKDTAAIASVDLTEEYGLSILQQNIANCQHNYTRFISVSPSLYNQSGDNRIVIAFSLPHQSGSLADALSIFADYKINLSHIQSRPRPDTPWEYCFYVDFDGNLSDHNTRAVLLQLELELPMLKILGSYKT
ncbi:MAG: chorismate mutase, partial [Clostridiales bacterium]|nr:chorismate mutase [Clostridiales bacterium]